VNLGPSCTDDADCASLAAIAPAAWRCGIPTHIDQLAAEAGGAAAARSCELRHPSGELYCDTTGDCPVRPPMPAYSETVECTPDHRCEVRGHPSGAEDAP
jgi:hypothetical protein